MVTLTADVTEGIRKMTKQLVQEGIYKSQSEVVRDAIRQLALKYGFRTGSDVRGITASVARKHGETLSEATRRTRDEAS